jgi:hypothetical protein
MDQTISNKKDEEIKPTLFKNETLESKQNPENLNTKINLLPDNVQIESKNKIEPSYQKFDENGNYLSFHGYTHISFLELKPKSEWEEWHRKLESLIPNSYRTLPLESFHMTVRNLFTLKHFKSEKDPKSSFEEFFKSNEKEIKSLISEEPFKESTIHAFVKKENLYYDMSIGIEIQFKNELEYMKLKEISAFREDLFDKEIKKYHMTLAYWISDPKLTQEEILKLQLHLEKIPPLNFYPPTVCYFPNMKEFIPLKTE